ncbi:hypothetical protein BBJ28_00003326 [Nothophytophthora sp. Chile5]|nr:hypothetical protein BBJ28_00003326 [Nothophytophthora sp. Chile5]
MEPSERKRVAVTSSFFPVAESLLPQLHISAAQHEELRRFALQAALDAIRDGPTWGRSNVECAVADGWKVLSARPTACFLTKRQSKKKKAAKKTRHRHRQQYPDPDDKRTPPRTPRIAVPGVTGLPSIHGSGLGGGAMPFAPFAPVPLEAASGQSFMAHAVLPNSLEDVMNTLYCEHTREMRALKRKVYGATALDCCVVQTLEGATLEDPFWYLGLKWMALRSPMQALVASREFVFLEHLGTHVDPESGRRLLYRVTQSVHIRGYGGQDSYFGLTRGHIEAAFVYWMDDENEAKNPLLHVCAKGRIHLKGKLPSGLMYRYIKAFWRSERSLFPADRSSESSVGVGMDDEELPFPEEKQKKHKKKKARRQVPKIPMGQPLEMAHEWVADELRRRCAVCSKKFRLVTRFKHHCRACGEVICRDCMYQHRLNVRDTRGKHEGELRGTVAASLDIAEGHNSSRSTNFTNTEGSSIDNQDDDGDGRPFSGELSLVKVTNKREMEPAILGGNPVVCVVMAKVCRRCLHSAPLANASHNGGSNRRRRRNSMISMLSSDLSATMAEREMKSERFRGAADFSYTWTAPGKDVEDLDDEISLRTGTAQQQQQEDLPMLVDDADTHSVDGLGELKARPGSYALDARPGSYTQEPRASFYARMSRLSSSYIQEPRPTWTGSYVQEDGGLDSNANHERVMILSPHALSSSSSLTSSQMHALVETDGSSGHSEQPSQQSVETPSDTDGDEGIEFHPDQSLHTNVADDRKPAASESSYYPHGFDPNHSLFELQDEEKELAASAEAAKAAVSATERVLRRMRSLQDEALYQTQSRQAVSPSSSTTSFYSDDDVEDEASEVGESMVDLRQALAQVESSLADQARLLFTIEQEQKKEAGVVFAAAASS